MKSLYAVAFQYLHSINYSLREIFLSTKMYLNIFFQYTFADIFSQH